jgi:crossover junction endodeoxyribonuclease RusA
MRLSITLPWPPVKACSPNSRAHWAAKSKAAKRYRATCARLVYSAVSPAGRQQVAQMARSGGGLHLWLTFNPPDKRRRDDDNLVAAFKSGRDGIADALGIDDSLLRVHPWVSTTVAKGGEVVAVLTDGPQAVQEPSDGAVEGWVGWANG